MEIQSAEIRSNQSYTFTFSDKIDNYIVGFSKLIILYDKPDHHVQKISFDLSNCQLNNNEIVITPRLRMNDISNHTESLDSIITVVVFALLGHKNTSIHMAPNVKTGIDHILPLHNPLYCKSTLSSSMVQYPDEDHHLNKFVSTIKLNLQDGTFSLNGQSTIQDRHAVLGQGEVYGSVFIYNGKDHKIICADFDSEKVGPSGEICFGKKPKKVHFRDYQLGCFINHFELAYNKSEDHHVLKIEVSAELEEPSLIKKDGELYAKINLKSSLTDNNNKHQTDIPHNSVSGFIIAFNNKIEQ